jgi:multicomponent Na+:H+ antiporter subunit E
MNRLVFGSVLLAIWLLLWGSASLGDVLSGIVVVALVLWLLGGPRRPSSRPVVRPLAAARFIGAVIVGVVKANAVLTREILTPRSSINIGVVAVPLPVCSDELLTLIANVLALTPGTMPVEVRNAPPVIYVHVLHLHDIESVRRDVRHLTALAVRAFGSPSARAALSGAEGGP